MHRRAHPGAQTMTYVLVDRDQLDKLLKRTWEMFELLAEEAGYTERNLTPDSELVTLAVQAGLLIPGPLQPGTVPPPPPHRRFRGGTPLAGWYRAEGDERIRCEADAKVIYGTMEQAESAARLISSRQPMKAYQGDCGHYHVARRKK